MRWSGATQADYDHGTALFALLRFRSFARTLIACGRPPNTLQSRSTARSHVLYKHGFTGQERAGARSLVSHMHMMGDLTPDILCGVRADSNHDRRARTRSPAALPPRRLRAASGSDDLRAVSFLDNSRRPERRAMAALVFRKRANRLSTAIVAASNAGARAERGRHDTNMMWLAE